MHFSLEAVALVPQFACTKSKSLSFEPVLMDCWQTVVASGLSSIGLSSGVICLVEDVSEIVDQL